jgi:2-phospho-L-lactate guanylyltransferase
MAHRSAASPGAGRPAVSDAAGWVVVVPVKDAARAKTRLAGAVPDGLRAELSLAMALDTIGAALAARPVAEVVVVGGDRRLRGELDGWARLRVEAEPPVGERDGLNAAVEAGVRGSRRRWPGCSVAVLLADLPSLTPVDLTEALVRASGYPRALVADVDGTGTTLLTAADGAALHPEFGPGSAAAHRAAGHVLLDLPVTSGLRRDVDLPGDLQALAAGRPGRWTAGLLDRYGLG